MGLKWHGRSQTAPGAVITVGEVVIVFEYGRKVGVYAPDGVEIKCIEPGKDARKIKAACEESGGCGMISE